MFRHRAFSPQKKTTTAEGSSEHKGNQWLIHQEIQVPKMEVLNLIRLFWERVFPYISRIHTAYIGKNLHLRYLKCSVINKPLIRPAICGGVRGPEELVD